MNACIECNTRGRRGGLAQVGQKMYRSGASQESMVAVATKNILVVDDEPAVQAMVREVLETAGYRVETAADGAEALEMVADHMPDLILLDMRMPKVDGPTFAVKFRERYRYQVPIIGFTAAANCDGCDKEVWANGWLWKPFEVDDLLRTIRRHVR